MKIEMTKDDAGLVRVNTEPNMSLIDMLDAIGVFMSWGVSVSKQFERGDGVDLFLYEVEKMLHLAWTESPGSKTSLLDESDEGGDDEEKGVTDER